MDKDNYFSRLPKDVTEKIVNELTPQEFINFCKNKVQICQSNEVFIRRMNKDFKFVIPYLGNNWKANVKQYYLKIFTTISKSSEEFANENRNLLGISQYLNSKFDQDLYDYIFPKIVKFFKNFLKERSDPDHNIDYSFSVLAALFGEKYSDYSYEYLPECYHRRGYQESTDEILVDTIKKFTFYISKVLNLELTDEEIDEIKFEENDIEDISDQEFNEEHDEE